MAVRRESVRLDVEGNFAQKVLEDAAAVEALKGSLKDLSGSSVQTSRSQDGLGRSVDGVGKSTERTAKSTRAYGLEQAILDERTRRTSAALRDQANAAVDAEQGIKRVRKETQGLQRDTKGLNLLWTAAGAGFPVVGPLGAVGAAGLAGIANDAGMAATSVASLLLALHGVMPALKAVNKASLEPTAANLQAASLAMQQLSPDARKFVVELQSMEPLLHKIQASAASGWFHGLDKALEDLRPLAPVIGKIFHDTGVMGGKLAAEGAHALAGPQWADFFKFIDTEAPKAMAAIGHVVGSLTHGLAELWMALSPLNNGFNNWLVDVAKGFDSWATGLSQTQGFHDFIAYVDQNGPKVAAAVGAIANAVIQIVQASAPLGGPTLDAITAIAKALGFIANSPLGTPILLLIQIASVARLTSSAVAGLGAAFGLMGEKAVVAGEEARAAAGAGGSGGPGRGGGFIGAGRLGAYGLGLYALDHYGPSVAHKLTGSPDVNPATVSADPKMLQTLVGNLQFVNNPINNNPLAEGLQYGLQGLSHGFGLLGSGSTPMKTSTDAINGVDQALADMVRSGNATKAAAEMDQIIAAGEKQGVTAEQTRAAMNDYAKAVAEAGNANPAAARKMGVLRAANHQTADSFVNLSAAMTKPTLSLDHLLNRWRSQAAAEAAMGKNIATAIAKGANPEALSKIIDQLGPQAGLAIQQLARGGKQGIADLNTAFHAGQRAANVYNGSLSTLTKTLLGIPTHVTTVVKVSGTDAAKAAVAQLRADMANPIIQNVIVRHHGQSYTGPGTGGGGGSLANLIGGGPSKKGKADGGTIPKTGRPYADRHPYLLADGEEVISNRHGQADRNRALLKAINANRMASGGTAGRWSGGSGEIDYDRLGHAVARHMPRSLNVNGRLKVDQDHGTMRAIAKDEIDQDHAFWK